MADLDIDLLRTFVALAETESFTRAGERLGATQSAVSVRLKKLEDRLGRRLLDRTPRAVTPTLFGETFLADARRLLGLHDTTLARLAPGGETRRFALGVSEHSTADRLPAVLRALRRAAPGLELSVTLDLSEELLIGFDAGRFDAVVVRRSTGPTTGTVLFADDLVWAAAADLAWRPGDPVPLVAIARPCRLCEMAIDALEAAGLPWRFAFASRDLAAVQAAASAGLGIAVLGRSSVPRDCDTLGPESGLPQMAPSEVVLFGDHRDRHVGPLLDLVVDAFRALPADAARRRA